MGKKIGVLALALLLLAAVALGLLWKRLTALPDWYESPEMLAEDGSLQVDEDWVRIPYGEPHAGAHVIRNPHRRAQTKRAPLHEAIKESRATYERGELEAGAVLNLAKLDLDSLESRERERYQKSIEAFPALAERDVYVGIEGGIDRGDGSIALGRASKLRIGETRYSLASAAKRLQMTEAELREVLEEELARLQVQVPSEAK